MMITRKLTTLTVLSLALCLTPALARAQTAPPSKPGGDSQDVLTADVILGRIAAGANLRIFGKEIPLSSERMWLDITKDNIRDEQVLFDQLLTKLILKSEPRVVIGGGLVLIELDRAMGKKKENQLRLVDLLSSQLISRQSDVAVFALRALTDDYFADATVFSDRARQNIYEAIDGPSMLGAFTDIESPQRSYVMLVAKAAGGEKEGIAFLEKIRRERERLRLLCTTALARVNVREEQEALLNGFKGAVDLNEKYRYAYALSAWGGREAQEALAAALRTPGLVKPWGGARPPEMIALHIAIALVQTIQEGRDELPKRDFFSWTEADFLLIEKWAEKHLGTTWRVPRPEYHAVEIIPF